MSWMLAVLAGAAVVVGAVRWASRVRLSRALVSVVGVVVVISAYCRYCRHRCWCWCGCESPGLCGCRCECWLSARRLVVAVGVACRRGCGCRRKCWLTSRVLAVVVGVPGLVEQSARKPVTSKICYSIVERRSSVRILSPIEQKLTSTILLLINDDV